MPTTKMMRLATTGRLSSRLSATDKAKLTKRLQAFALTEEDWRQFSQTELEIGMGNGLALFERAKAQPERLFVGVELYLNGLRSLVNQLEKNPDVSNVRIVGADVRDVLAALPAQRLDRVVIPYPDPWPKAKHHKRRLVQADLLAALAPCLAEEGELVLITDIVDYALWMLREVYTQRVFMPAVIGPAEWATPPAWWVRTKYEQKALQEGRKPWYITCKKTLHAGEKVL